MNLTVVGTGYVGLVTGTCFAEMGHKVTCVDVDNGKIENLKNGILPIYEPGLDAMVANNASEKRLDFTTSLREAMQDSDIYFIAVGTPPGEDGSADLPSSQARPPRVDSVARPTRRRVLLDRWHRPGRVWLFHRVVVTSNNSVSDTTWTVP